MSRRLVHAGAVTLVSLLLACHGSKDHTPSQSGSPANSGLGQQGTIWEGLSAKLSAPDFGEVGKPVRVRLDLCNNGPNTFAYDHQSVDGTVSFDVIGPNGPAPRLPDEPRSTGGSIHVLSPGHTVNLSEFNLSMQFRLSLPGKYRIRFNGHGLWVADVREIRDLVKGHRESSADDPIIRSDWIELTLEQK